MNDIILSTQNGQAVVSSLDIAEKFEKRHDNVMRDVESWRDYEGDQLQVVIDGVTYLVHSSNVVLRHDREKDNFVEVPQ